MKAMDKEVLDRLGEKCYQTPIETGTAKARLVGRR
jgi:hypothetical protein